MISEELQNLLLKYCEPEDELLRYIDRETQLKVLLPRMLSGHYQGRVLSLLSKINRPKRILEIGTSDRFVCVSAFTKREEPSRGLSSWPTVRGSNK